MVLGFRYFAWCMLFFGGAFCLVSGLSFSIDSPLMSLNGRAVESPEDKMFFVAISIGLVLGALGLLAVLRKGVLQRNVRVWRTAYRADTVLLSDRHDRVIFSISAVVLILFAGIVALRADPAQRLIGVLIIPFGLLIGFGGSHLFLRGLTLHPFTSESLGRAFSLMLLAAAIAGTITSFFLVALFPQGALDSSFALARFARTPLAMGVAYGMAFSLRKSAWFEPLLDPPPA